MWNDPIVEETRRSATNTRRSSTTIEALVRDLKEQERQSGREVVSFPPRKPQEDASHAA